MTGKVEEDQEQLVDKDELALEIQPHLSASSQTDQSNRQYSNPTPDVSAPSITESAENSSSQCNGLDHRVDNSKSVVCARESQPVYYSSKNGKATIVREAIVITKPDGSREIQTKNYTSSDPQRWRDRERERPLRLRHIKFMKVFAVIAVVVCFPTGVAALIYALKCEKEFHEGITNGNIDDAKKSAKIAERLIILSGFLFIIIVVVILGIIEQKLEFSDYGNNHRVMPH